MAEQTIIIVRTELSADVSRSLIAALNAELQGLYSEPGANHFQLDSSEVSGGRGAFLVAYRGTTPLGCGAVRRLDAETAELKRMYVAPAERGRGLGRRILAALEAEARALGVSRLVLETGIRQAAALALYRANGFDPIPLYGEYNLSPGTSVCLGKVLSRPPSLRVEIRRLRREERDEWLDLRKLLWPDAARDELANDEELVLADAERGIVLVAAAPGGDLRGFVEVAIRDWAEGCDSRPVGYLEAWFVRPEHRRAGLGRQLLQAAERWVLERGCCEMGSDADLHNETSHRAHRALGFAEVGKAVLFSKKLAP